MTYIDDWTDGQLDEIIDRLKRVYAAAAKETKERARAYWKDFREQDKTMREKLEKGLITEKKYQKWRREMLLDGKVNEDMRDLLAAHLTQINVDAAGIINGETPLIFAENHNYAAFGFEKEYGNLAFTLYDEETVMRLVTKDPELLPTMPPKLQIAIKADKRWNMRKFSDTIISGILQGKSIDHIADDLQNVVGMQRTAAIRNARTAVTSAENGGRQASYEHAAAMGVQVRKRWIATKDNRTRDSHAAMDGVEIGYAEAFSTPLGSQMLYPGDTNGKPADLYNCRCTVSTVEDSAEPRMMRVRDPVTGKNVLVHEMTYSKWKEWAKERENQGGG